MAAQDAELKLKVSLDLAFFRQQLAGLGQAAAGTPLPVQIRFDRRSVQNELNALGANIRRRNYTLNVNTNLSAEIAKADTLARKLAELSGKVKAAAGGAFSQGPQGAAGLERFMREQGLTGRAFGVQQSQERIARQAVLSRLEKGSLSKGGYNIAGLEKIIRDLGGTPTGGRKDLAAQAKKLVEESDGIADAVFESLKDLQMKLRPIRGQAQTSAPRSMPNLNEMLDRIANLTENPRAAQRMLRMLPERRITTDLIGAANKQAEFRQEGLKFLDLKGKPFDPLLKAIAKDFTDYTKSVNISDPWVGQIGNGIAKIVAKAATSPQAQRLLPAAGQTSATRFNPNITRPIFAAAQAAQAGGGQRFSFANRIGSLGQFPMAGMMGPSTPLSINARTSMFGGGGMQPPGGGGGGGGMGGFGGFGRALGGVPNLPGSGVIRELGSEFAFATKQVLLFGQAYKLLGVLQDFPAQVGAAVGQLQNFRNTLGAITPTAEEARASNELILDLMNRYNVPLQSARDGFTKLYASMAPAGFSGDEIRDLFTGITQAAATFGMSADKVDRVNYAFAQMASKGQVMSEELKGQLGDVLPGAMALFAEAAGFEGPQAIQDFSAALEDGAYKGEAMVALLKNVGIVMKQEFGPGAEGAARTFQGVINRMQNSMVLLYESFEPVAVGFLNTVVVPMTSGIKTLSDGLNAFFTGTAAKTAGGFAIAQELERLRPAFDGIGQNVSALIAQFGDFAKIALEVGKVFLQIAGSPIVGYLAKLYAIVLPINIALNAMRALWAANALQLVIFNARVATGTGTLTAFRSMMAATGATSQATAASIRATGVTLRTFFSATGVGLVIVGISALIEKIMEMNRTMADTRAKALGAAQAIRAMSQTEARQAAQQYEAGAKSLENLNQQVEEGKTKGKAWIQVTSQQAKALQDAGITVSNVRGSMQVQPTRIPGAFQKLQGLAGEARYRERTIKSAEELANIPAGLATIPESAGDGTGGKTKKLDSYNKSQLDFIKQRFEKEKQILDQQLQANLLSKTSYDIKLAELTLETERADLQERFRLESEKIQKDNLSAADKALALKDQEVKLANGLAIAEKQRDIAVKGAKLELRKPFIEALRGENLQIDKQYALLQRLKGGYSDLTPEQEASFIIEERTANLKADERKLIEADINNLKQQIQLRIENARLLEKEQGLQSARQSLGVIGTGLTAGFTGSAANIFERTMEQYGDRDYATQLANIETAAMQLRSVFEGLQGAIQGVSSAFANVLTEGVTSMITGTATAKEVFANFLQSVGQALSQAASQMIATYIAIGIAKIFAGFSGGGATKMDLSGTQTFNVPVSQMPAGMQFANGGIAPGGFRAFANGGVVSGPTLGLVGEGKYNEAIVPLPDGKSIPVQLGSGSLREAMGSAPGANAGPPTLNMSFETTNIGGVEYVSREQLEQAMAATRRQAANDGAKRGMSMTLDRLQQSPQTRRRVGI